MGFEKIAVAIILTKKLLTRHTLFLDKKWIFNIFGYIIYVWVKFRLLFSSFMCEFVLTSDWFCMQVSQKITDCFAPCYHKHNTKRHQVGAYHRYYKWPNIMRKCFFYLCSPSNSTTLKLTFFISSSTTPLFLTPWI